MLGKEYKYPNGYKFIGFLDKDGQNCILSQWPEGIAIIVQNVSNQTFMRMSIQQSVDLANAIISLSRTDA